MFYGVIHEGYILDSKDVKYQVDEFLKGEVKTLFITGQSGSGKSTVARKYKEELKIPCYELDDIGWNDKYATEEDLKKVGPELYAFFTGPGKKYRIQPGATEIDFYSVQACADFIKFIISKNARCIVEGIQIFMALDEKMLDINVFENSALLIKGTSGAKSVYRGTKRDLEIDKKQQLFADTPLKGKRLFTYVVEKIKYMLHDEKALKEMRNKYKNKKRS
jgi:hypothetical protein